MTIVAGTHVSKAGHDTITSTAIDTTAATPGGLLVRAVSRLTSTTAPTPSDSKSNTWTGLTETTNASLIGERLWYVLAPATDAAHTFTSTNSTTFNAIAVMAFSGVGTYHSENGASTTSASTLNTGSVTPPSDGCLLVAAVSIGTALLPTIDSGMTIVERIDIAGGVNFGVCMAYVILGVGTGGVAINPQWGFGTNQSAVTRIAVFAPTAGTSLFRIKRDLNGLGAGGPFFSNPLG